MPGTDTSTTLTTLTTALTTKRIRHAVPPKTGAITLWDGELTGFGLRLYCTGAKSFFLNYRLDGRERRHTIGPFPRWSVAAARERAKELRRLVDSGHDPAGEKRQRREAPTVQDLIGRYITEHLPTKKGGPDRQRAERVMLARIGELLGRHEKVADIHGGDIKDMHRKLTEQRGPVAANRYLALASKMFSLSLVPMAGESSSWRNALIGNPCKGIARNHEEGCERFFSRAELNLVVDALNQYPPEAYELQKGPGRAAADCIKLIMLTGCRPSEARLAQWPEFDKEPGFWVKPSAHVKQKKIHRLPLSPPAIELIDQLRKRRSSTVKWVFPGRVPGEPVRTLGHCWLWVRDQAQLAPDEKGRPARPYDLRHTFASEGAALQMGLPLIGKLLGHTQSRTTQRYAHLSDSPLREAATKIGIAIAGHKEGGADVVPIKGGAA